MHFIAKKGLKKKYLSSLRKIYEFEAIKFETKSMPYDLNALCRELLLSAAFLKNLHFNLKLSRNYIFDRKLLYMLLLNICTVSDIINIFEAKDKIVIAFTGEINAKIHKAVGKLKGTLLKELKKNINYCILSFSSTNKKTEEIENAFSLIQNPLSVTHLYLSC